MHSAAYSLPFGILFLRSFRLQVTAILCQEARLMLSLTTLCDAHASFPRFLCKQHGFCL